MVRRFPSSLAILAGLACSRHAAAQLWDGGGANDNWGTANNWNPNGVPVNDGTANVGFRGTVRLTPVINGAVDVRSITFVSPAGSFDINPGGFRAFLTIGAGGVTNNDASLQTISNPIRLAASQAWTAASGPLAINAVDGQGNTLTVTGGFDTSISRHSGSSSPLVKNGPGTLFLTGNSTGGGGLTVNAGVVSIDADARLGGHDVVVNAGTLAVTADTTMMRDITLTGPGATLNAAGHQLSYDAGVLTVNGGTVTSQSGFLGAGLPSDGTATVRGDASLWVMAGGFGVGYQDRGTLLVADGGRVQGGTTHIGSLPGSVGVATVTGPGSSWTCGGFLGVGYSGAGTLTVDNGGSVSSDSCFVAADPGSAGHVVVSGGSWSVAGSPVIGEHGVGELTVVGGGAVTDGGAFIGRFGDGDGHASVSGAGSRWTNNGALTVAGSGRGVLTVDGGGVVTSTGSGMIAGNPGSVGSVAITAASVTTAELFVGFAGLGTLSVGPGGLVSSAAGTIAATASADGSAATIDGAGARWTLSGDLGVGEAAGGSLTIRNGGGVSGRLATIGQFVGGHGTALVTGPGSAWTADNIAVGYLSGAGSLTVEAGGHATCQNGSVGNSSGTGAALVTGAGSAWDIPGALSIGFLGSGTLVLDAGASMTTSLLGLGFGSGASGAATITGAGSTWAVGFELRMAESGAGGSFTINGGLVSVAGDITDGGAGVSTLVLDGGTLDLQGHAVGAAAPNAIDNLVLRSGTLRNVAGINGGAGLSKTGPGTLILSTANTYSGPTVVNAGELRVANTGGSATGPGPVSVAAGASLSGAGRVAGAVQNRGTVAPGSSPGILSVGGNYAQIGNGALTIEIGGVTPGTQHDRLAVGGGAALAGVLDVALINGFVPGPGDAFDILTSGSRTGTFAAVNLPALSGGTWRLEYLPTGVRLTVACPADFNGDGFLDFFDYDDYVSCFESGACPPGRDADFNGDGFADFFDYDDFVTAFEAGC